MRFVPLAALLLAAAVPLPAQTVAEHLAMRHSLRRTLQSEPALRHYQEARALEPGSYEASRQAARERADVGKRPLGDSHQTRAPRPQSRRPARSGVCLDVGETAKATEQLQALAGLPGGDPMDPYYQRLSAAALQDIVSGHADDARDRLRKG